MAIGPDTSDTVPNPPSKRGHSMCVGNRTRSTRSSDPDPERVPQTVVRVVGSSGLGGAAVELVPGIA
eukprot:2689910-Rhodomonas_salina.2